MPGVLNETPRHRMTPGTFLRPPGPNSPPPTGSPSTHRNPLAHVPAGQLLEDVERLPHLRVVEASWRARGVVRRSGAPSPRAWLHLQEEAQGQVCFLPLLLSVIPAGGAQGHAHHPDATNWWRRKVKCCPESWTKPLSFSCLLARDGRWFSGAVKAQGCQPAGSPARPAAHIGWAPQHMGLRCSREAELARYQEFT